MPIGIDDAHTELADSLRAWADAQGAVADARAAEHDPTVLTEWVGRSAQMGVPVIGVPEPVGGGGTWLDQAVALEAAARALVPGPLLGTSMAAQLLDDDKLLAAIADGEASVGWGLQPSLELDEGLLRGEVVVVLDAPSATHVLLGAGERWFVVPTESVTVEPGTTPDLSRTVGTVRLDDLPVDSLAEVTATSAEVHRVLVTLAAAEASGVARWCLDAAVAYAGVREQFGRPIGAFQAVKHLCAEMLETSESVTAAAWDAARAADEDEPQQELAAHVAATVCFDGTVEVAKACIQVLGGIGFTFEHDAHLYLRRALALRSAVGPSSRAAAELATLVASGVRRRPAIELAEGAGDRQRVRAEAERIAGLPTNEQRTGLVDTGLLTPHWPHPYGRGAGPVEQLVIDEELERAGVDRPDLKIGAWAAPTILAHGSDEQRERFVRPTLTGEVTWCQLFSEPEAGSDLASLRTRAVKTDDGWRLTGQKVWTSMAHEADWGICLARTDPDAPPHHGITYFLVDMRSDGIEIRPLRELTGEEMFNEVFLDDVLVPDDCVVGEVNGGWRLARTTLANERVAMAGARLGDSVERALELARDETERVRAGHAVASATVVKLLGTRATLRALAGQGPGPESSVAKLVGVRSRQDSAELVVDLLGDRVFSGDALAREAMHELLLTRCLSIAGGTTQVLRNVAAERILGLPRG